MNGNLSEGINKERLVELMGGAKPTSQEQIYLDKMREQIDAMFAKEEEKARVEQIEKETRIAYMKECKTNRNKHRNMLKKLRRKG